MKNNVYIIYTHHYSKPSSAARLTQLAMPRPKRKLLKQAESELAECQDDVGMLSFLGTQKSG